MSEESFVTTMKPRHPLLPYGLLLAGWAAFVAYVWITSGQLPARVATHFGAGGEPNGWETHSGYLHFTLFFGAAVPAFVLAVFHLGRLGGGALLNIPHREYWLAPERREETLASLDRVGVRFAGLLVAFFAVLHHFILAANA
jgi:hypothetical protein